MGNSLGTGVVVDLASRRPYGALVLISPYTSVPDVAQGKYPWLPARIVMRNRFDSLAKIGLCTSPVFIAHGTHDAVVPYAHGEKLFEAVRAPKYFCRLEGIEHDPAAATYVPFLRRFLQNGKAIMDHSPAKCL